MQFILSVLVAALVGLSCTAVTYPPRGSGPRSQFNQSCGAACGAPISSGTGEILAPAAHGTGQVLDKVVRAAETLQGLATLERVLTSAELDRVEAILRECVAQAHADVNEAYQQQKNGRTFKNRKFPNDEECKKIVGVTDKGQPVSLAQELGRLKHAAAFACINARLSKEFPDNITVEPRYKPDPEVNGVELTDGGLDTLHPDFVVHATRNAAEVQCVYEFKFPCLSEYKLDPRTSPGVLEQLKAYQDLTRRCPAAVISPEGLFQYQP